MGASERGCPPAVAASCVWARAPGTLPSAPRQKAGGGWRAALPAEAPGEAPSRPSSPRAQGPPALPSRGLPGVSLRLSRATLIQNNCRPPHLQTPLHASAHSQVQGGRVALAPGGCKCATLRRPPLPREGKRLSGQSEAPALPRVTVTRPSAALLPRGDGRARPRGGRAWRRRGQASLPRSFLLGCEWEPWEWQDPSQAGVPAGWRPRAGLRRHAGRAGAEDVI